MFGRTFIVALLAVLPILTSAQVKMAYEKSEEDLMRLIMEDQEKRGRAVITHDAAEEFSKFIKVLHDTRQMSDFDNVWVSETDEARSSLYVAMRRSSFYFHTALGAAIDEEAAIKAEKGRAEQEQARGMRALIVVLDADTTIDKKAEMLMTEERKKLTEAFERAKKEHDIARIKLNGLRYDCARTILASTCRWLGNFKSRVVEAENFENLTRNALLESRAPGVTQEEELKHFKELANDPPRIQREVEFYKSMIPELTKKLAEVEPKTRLLREIDVSFQKFLRRDDSLSYSANQSVSDLKDLFGHVKTFYSRFVGKHRTSRFAPPQMISQLAESQITALAKQFGKAIHELDFESMLDFDDYQRQDNKKAEKRVLIGRRKRPHPLLNTDDAEDEIPPSVVNN